MKVLSAMAITGAALLSSGCAVFSTAEFGPTDVNGTTIDEVIRSAGAPDVVGGSANHLVLGWHRVEGLSILGLFQTTTERSYAAVFDNRGNVMGQIATKENGRALSILGPISPLTPNNPTR